MRLRSAIFGLALLLPGAVVAQEMEIKVELMGPLGTKSSHKGDRVFARVLQPEGLKGDTVDGTVKEVRSGGKLHGNSVLNFSFETLQHGGQAVAIGTEIRGFRNSKGQAEVDEEGRVIRRGGGNTGKAVAGTAAGGLIGGIAGGWKGAAIGTGAGAVASIAIIEIAADSPEIRFDAGSIISLSARTHSGPPLSSLTGAPSTAAPVSQPAPSYQAASNTSARVPATPAAAAPVANQTSEGQPDFTVMKADFITGEKVLFYDDFTDMAGDEPPPHWKVRGTTAELKVGAGVRQMTVKGNAVLTPNLKGLPQNFTMETELAMDGTGDDRPELNWLFLTKDGSVPLLLRTKQEPGNTWWVRMDTKEDRLGESTVPADWRRPVKLALWIQNGRVRLYVNEQRIFDVNQVTLPAIATVENRLDTGRKPVGYQLVRFAESTPDFSHTILSAGRYVTYGILFDTGSDRLKPESAAVIKSIAAGLQANAGLKLKIEGHTDSTGDAALNLDLSRRRAEAVKQVLMAEFQIDGARLTTAGLGATKPLASNEDPQGRAQNRRVEFVKE